MYYKSYAKMSSMEKGGRLNAQFDFINQATKLKRVDRRGWVERGIVNPESVAEHSQRMAIIALLLADENGVDKNRATQMALIHDHPEIITRDISPSQKISPEEKFRREDEAMQELCAKISNGEEMYGLWREFEDKKTETAIFVEKCDKIEMMFQAYEYGIEQPDVDLSEFWIWSEKFNFGNLDGLFQFLKLQAKK